MATKTKPRIAALTLAVCALEVRPGEPLVRIFPAGRFDAPRGALSGTGPWFTDAGIAAQVIARVASRSTDIPIDYEHQILLSEKNGQPAPAAGWIDRSSLVWVGDGDKPGIYAAVRWTARASGWIEDESYKYLSPVFPYDPTNGAVLDLLHVALTNTPGIDSEQLAAASARIAAEHAHGGLKAETTSQEIPEVNELLKKLLAALGLPETTSEADAVAGVAALKAKADEAQTQIAALKSATPDPAQFVPVSTMQALQGEVAALSARLNTDEATRMIDAAMAEGKLIEAQRDWAEALGKKDIAALKGYIETAPGIAALKGLQTNGKQLDQQQQQTSDADLAVCKALGLTPEEFAKGKTGGA